MFRATGEELLKLLSYLSCLGFPLISSKELSEEKIQRKKKKSSFLRAGSSPLKSARVTHRAGCNVGDLHTVQCLGSWGLVTISGADSDNHTCCHLLVKGLEGTLITPTCYFEISFLNFWQTLHLPDDWKLASSQGLCQSSSITQH